MKKLVLFQKCVQLLVLFSVMNSYRQEGEVSGKLKNGTR